MENETTIGYKKYYYLQYRPRIIVMLIIIGVGLIFGKIAFLGFDMLSYRQSAAGGVIFAALGMYSCLLLYFYRLAGPHVTIYQDRLAGIKITNRKLKTAHSTGSILYKDITLVKEAKFLGMAYRKYSTDQNAAIKKSVIIFKGIKNADTCFAFIDGKIAIQKSS